MPIKLSYDICKTIESVHVNFKNKSKKLKELKNEIKSLKNLSQPFKTSCSNTLDEQQNRIKMQIKAIYNKINENKQAINEIDTKLKEKYNDIKLLNVLIKNNYNLSLVTNEHDYENMKNVLTTKFKSEINDLNQEKETIKIRLNKNENKLAYFNNKLEFLSYPNNKETLEFLFYTEFFPNEIERESIQKEKINIDCIKNMINIHEKGLFISSDSQNKLQIYKDF
ncbi:TPA: hypothetical protein ACPUE9_002346 [Proteus mirabilis]